MNRSDLLYRTRQFWTNLRSGPLSDQNQALVAGVLTQPQRKLFNRMQPGEQQHAVQVLQTLLQQGLTQPDLQVAALLHDVGKSRVPLAIWERVLIVLARLILPKQVNAWGQGEPAGWRRAFVVAEQHPAWGGQLVAEAGASALAIDLIAWHQSAPPASWDAGQTALLVALQRADDRN